MVDVLTAWDLTAKYGLPFVLFLAVALLIAGVLMPKANHVAIITAHLSIIAEMQKSIDLLRVDRDGWRLHAEKGVDAQTASTHMIGSLTIAVERLREAIALCQAGGRK